ncbi:MAG: helix-turn-helix transcriptional regulator [Clostridia bacterium]|nr:helix-turn-helix transcriptional regulator [Clostridia bacterium]
MQNYKKEMGRRIKEKRRELKLTQENLAEMLGVSVKHLSEVERGIAGLSVENIVFLSNAFDVSIDYLIKGDMRNSTWQSVITLLETVPEEKVQKVKELIKGIVEIADNK